MKNRISKYDAVEWLALLIKAGVIKHGAPVVMAHGAMRSSPEICRFADDEEEGDNEEQEAG